MESKDWVSADEVNDLVARGKKYIFAYFVPGTKLITDLAQQELAQLEHLQFLFTLKKQGKLALAGPITDDNSIRGIMIFNSDNKDEVKTILDADPFVKRGHFRVVILNFFGLPGDTLP